MVLKGARFIEILMMFGLLKTGKEISKSRLSFLLNLPAILFMMAIIAYPIAFAIYLAFHRVGIRELRTGKMPFYGLGNFQALLQDEVFWISIKQTFEFSIFVVILEVLLGLGIALVIHKTRGRMSTFIRVIMLLPWAVPPIVNALLWRFIFSSQYGYLNAVLYSFGFIDHFLIWLGNPKLALYCVGIAHIWRTTPFAILLIHAAMEGIPESLFEAAQVDGASAWQSFSKVMLPLLMPALILVMILRTTWAFQAFDEILGITGGGPQNATWVAAFYTYRYAFQPPQDVGLGAASSFFLALVIGIFAIVYIRFFRKVQVEWE